MVEVANGLSRVIQRQEAVAPSLSSAVRWFLLAAVAGMTMSAFFDVVDAQGTWSTAQLSAQRAQLAATTVGNVAMFAGGFCYYTDKGCDGMRMLKTSSSGSSALLKTRTIIFVTLFLSL
jgi:hypothetical protein